MYITTIPNIEAIRRICILNSVTECQLLIPRDTKKVLLRMDIAKYRIIHIEEELKSWCGMPFKVLSASDKNKENKTIQKHGIRILPFRKNK